MNGYRSNMQQYVLKKKERKETLTDKIHNLQVKG